MGRKLTIGILAHVDAGKTTLCEALLYLTGGIRQRGRVDHADTHFDTHNIERERGITLFSKQASLVCGDTMITLIDTPGHTDFSTEAERTLQILDYAVLVISGTDGVQTHTETLFKLLRHYNIPTLIFINKTDLDNFDRSRVVSDLHRRLGDACVDFTGYEGNFIHCNTSAGSAKPEKQPHFSKEHFEALAFCSDALLDEYVKTNSVSDNSVKKAIKECSVFPCFFGSALKLTGVEAFLNALNGLTLSKRFPGAFGAKVYKILHDSQGGKLTCMRITGGKINVRTAVSYLPKDSENPINEKISQIKIYRGVKAEQVDSAEAGDVVTVSGLTGTYPGLGLGTENNTPPPLLTPVLNYRVLLPEGCDPQTMLQKLKMLEDEDPALNIVWNDALHEINIRLMGEMQSEIVKSLVKERFDADIELDEGRILYLETIAAPIEGIGHFEPLRHYSEVHLIMEPLPRGSGLKFVSACAPNSLDLNFQRLILSFLRGKTHLGILTGSPVTDIKFTLSAGAASKVHTEGGDFREAAYRAVRQGLMKAENILLEPYYDFSIELPSSQLGRAINDIRLMNGEFSAPESDGETAYFTGRAPVSAMRGYTSELAAYTKGRGRLSISVSGYDVCKKTDEVINEIAYEPERDLANTPDSVFCAHGAGFVVNWREVENYMHIDTGFGKAHADSGSETSAGRVSNPKILKRNLDADEKALEKIMLREFGPIKRPEYGKVRNSQEESAVPAAVKRKDYLIIDGYNVIFAWEGLNRISQTDISLARKQLMNILSNYAGFKKAELAIVFDAYRVKDNPGEHFAFHNIRVAYTKENETADTFIEKLAQQIGKNYSVRVVTSDNLIQLSSFRSGVLRMSAKEFEKEVSEANIQLHEIMEKLKMQKASARLNIPLKF